VREGKWRCIGDGKGGDLELHEYTQSVTIGSIRSYVISPETYVINS